MLFYSVRSFLSKIIKILSNTVTEHEFITKHSSKLIMNESVSTILTVWAYCCRSTLNIGTLPGGSTLYNINGTLANQYDLQSRDTVL